MVERKPVDSRRWQVGPAGRWLRRGEPAPADECAEGWLRVQIRNDDNALDTGDLLGDFPDARQTVDLLPRITISIRTEQHRRLDLTEAIEHSLYAKVRRARRPRGAEARGRQHRNDGLRDVGHEPGNAVARPD